MMVVHFIPVSIFAVSYIAGWNNNFDIDHRFVVYGDITAQSDRGIKFDDISRIIFVNKIDKNAEALLKDADWVVYNCIPEDIETLRSITGVNEKYKFKIATVPWGRDLYRSSDAYRVLPEKDIVILDCLKEKLLSQSRFILAGNSGKNFIKQNFYTDAEIFWFNANNSFPSEPGLYKGKTSYGNNVMVGHRGTITSGHFGVLEKLRDIKTDLNNIICPLSYGNPDYIKEVRELGEMYFAERWRPITKWIAKEEYLSYLDKNVDVAIFNNSTSEGANTMFFLANVGKKVYVSPKNDVYGKLKALGYIVYPWDDSVDVNNILVPLTEIERKHNRSCGRLFKTKYDFLKNWNHVFYNL